MNKIVMYMIGILCTRVLFIAFYKLEYYVIKMLCINRNTINRNIYYLVNSYCLGSKCDRFYYDMRCMFFDEM